MQLLHESLGLGGLSGAPDTPGYYKKTAKVRSSAEVHSEKFKECVALQAQYIYDSFGKFPGTVPSILLCGSSSSPASGQEFYDHFFEEGAYLQSHKII